MHLPFSWHYYPKTMRRRPGFTLVELIIVLGIIVLLISILLPAINRAREQARRVECLSNIRQLTIAYLNYAYEHKGRLCSSEMQTPLGTDPNNWIFNEPDGTPMLSVKTSYAGLKSPPMCFFSWIAGGGGLSAKAG